jgi:outer membrane immunogenic protein
VANDPASALQFNAVVGGAPPPGSFRTSGVIGGLQLGYNYQLNRNWLIGVEADFDRAGIKGSGTSSGATTPAPFSVPFSATADEYIKWFGTVRARLGYLPADNLLVYVTGGFAYGQIERSGSYVNNGTAGFTVNGVGGNFDFTCGPGATCFTGSTRRTAST